MNSNPAVEGGATTARSSGPLAHKTLKNTVLKSHGRPPWYGEDGRRHCDAFVIGIAGGSASGKTHVARQIVSKLGNIPSVVILSQDSFYKKHSPDEIALAFASKFDFDHPDALDMDLFAECILDLKQCRQTNIPVYSFSKHQRLEETQYLYGAAIIIAEGIMALQDSSLRELYDLKVFVQCDSDTMLARRIKRDLHERGRDVDGILEQYMRFVKPAYDNFVNPTARYADIIVPGADNNVAIDLIATHIRRQLVERSRTFRARMPMSVANSPNVNTRALKRLSTPLTSPGDAPFLSPWPGHVHGRVDGGSAMSLSPTPSASATPETKSSQLRIGNGVEETWMDLIVLPDTPQLKGILTTLRDRSTSREDFIFFADRLATLLVERAMTELPYRSKTVTTPVDVESEGTELTPKYICGVTILRSGGALERGLRRVLQDVLLGTLLIQSEETTGEPLLLQSILPVCIRQRESAQDAWVFLLDAQIGTGATAFMSIRILLDHGVQQSHIIFVCYLVAREGGLRVLRSAFPEVRIICAAVDGSVREVWLEDGEAGEESERPIVVDGGSQAGELTLTVVNGEVEPKSGSGGRKAWIIEPGLGHIGDRYYL